MASNLRTDAFHAWYACGQNLTQAVKKLEKDGYSVTRQTLAKWCKEDNWQERATRLDAERQAASDAKVLTEDELLLASLKRQQERYEKYFETLEKPDPQATYAYNGLIKAIQETSQRVIAYRRGVFAEFFKDMIGFFRGHKPDVASAIETEFDAYITHIKGNNNG